MGSMKDSTAAAPAAAAAAPEAPGFMVVVLYNQPKDTAAFEKYYADKHLPLVTAKAKEIGFSKAVLIKFTSNADGSKPSHYREAQLWWPTEAALKAGMATEGFKAVAGDLKNFSTGGQMVLIGAETR
ncbi:MAG TPA: EthD family reductase [Gemmatimonadaceae bacterium]